jgi:hypothetical protein
MVAAAIAPNTDVQDVIVRAQSAVSSGQNVKSQYPTVTPKP